MQKRTLGGGLGGILGVPFQFQFSISIFKSFKSYSLKNHALAQSSISRWVVVDVGYPKVTLGFPLVISDLLL
jgi:hypothetical protein